MSKKDRDPKKPHNHKKVILIIAIIVIVLAGVGTGGYFAYKYFFPYGQIKIDSELSSKASDITSKYGYNAGQKYLDSALSQAKTDQEKAEVYTVKANLVFSNTDADNTSSQKAKDALDYAREAEQLNPTQVNILSLASLEESAGNIENAIKYYQMYIDRGASSGEDVVVSGDKEFYTNYINGLRDELNAK